MTNHELATQVLEQLKFGETVTSLANDRIYDAALLIALRKDEQFAAKKQELIDKACEWLKENFNVILESFNCGTIERVLFTPEIEERFRKAMEETE